MSAPRTSERWRLAIDRECERVSLSHLRRIAVGTFFLATLVALILFERVPHWRLGIWLTASYAMVLVRVGIGSAYAIRPRSDHELPFWLTLLVVTLASSSSIWGTLILVAPTADDAVASTTAILFTGGLMAGGAQSLMGTPRILVMIGVLNVAPILIVLLRVGGSEQRYLAATIIVYLVMIAQFARENRRLLRESLALRFDNLELVERRTEEKSRAEAARDIAERATAAKDQFLAAASHDIRQPIHAAFLFLGALETEARSSPDIVEKLRASLIAARQMLDALLDVSRLEAGVVERVDEDIDATDLARELERLLGAVAKRKHLSLKVYVSPDLWLRSDRGLCQRILANLVNNAIKYTQQGGVLVALRRQRNHCLVQVWDTGIGIARDDLPLIFDEFTQLNNPERDGSRGIGLGLAIVRRLCLLLGTHIQAQSRLGRGTVFAFQLPLGAPMPDAIVPHETHVVFIPARVLVVDDSPLIREGLAVLLRRWGYRVVVAENVDAAKHATELHRDIDVAIVDFRLPGNRTAFDALAAICTALGRDVPAVLITGDTHPQRIREATSAGYPVLFKPVPPDTLRITLRELTGSRGANRRPKPSE